LKITVIFPSVKIFMSQTRNKEWATRWIQHGIALPIAYAKKNGLTVDLIDVRRLRNWDEYAKRVSEYDALCFSVNSIDYYVYLECLKRAKEVNPKATVIVGGIHPTIKLSDFIKDSRVDYIIQKEGEIAFVNLLKQISSGKKDIPRVQVGEPVELDSVPYIDRDLWEKEYPWGLDFSGKPPFVTILTSRACLRNCFFCQPCARLMFGNVERRRSIDNVIGELRSLDEKYHFRSWMVHDDGFLQNLDWCKGFIRLFKEEFGSRPFIIQSRPDYPVRCKEIIPELRSIGLEWAILGFESGSDNVLKFLRKGTTRQMNLEAARNLRENGVKVFANIMFGVPTETREDIDLTMSMVREMEPDHFSPATYSPYPGSYLHDYCKERNLILTEHSPRDLGEHKIKGIDYEYIQKRVDEYRHSRAPIRYFLYNISPPPIRHFLYNIHRKVWAYR